MSQTARNNSHVSSACASCRRRKKKCSGSKPTCDLCAEKDIQCEWTVDSDGRRGCGRERDALRVETEKLKSELALLQAQLRDAGVEKVHDGVTYHAVQTQQLQLWTPEVYAGQVFQTSVMHQAATPAGAFTDTTPHALTVPTDSWSYSYLALDVQPASSEGTAGHSADEADVDAVNVFGPGEPPLSTSCAIPQEFQM